MSDSRVSSVIQEWVSSFPGQPHTQTLNPSTSNLVGSNNQLAEMDMISYNHSQGLVRGGMEDTVEMMGLPYMPYTPSCLSSTSSVGGTNNHQSHANSQQVRETSDFVDNQ